MTEIDFTDRYWGDAISWVGPGWHGIVLELDEKLREEAPGFTYGQVKEKFGDLRVYLHFDENMPESVRDRAEELVHEAVKKASRTCEDCGNSGSPRKNRSWIRTLCDTCDSAGES